MSESKEVFAIGTAEAPTSEFFADKSREDVEQLLSPANPCLWLARPVAQLKVKLQPVRKAYKKREKVEGAAGEEKPKKVKAAKAANGAAESKPAATPAANKL